MLCEMTQRQPTILVTGFGPFPDMPVNASARLIADISAAAPTRFPRIRCVSAVLPTEWHEAPRRLGALVARHAPSVAVHFGVSSSIAGFAVERLACNEWRYTPDATGALPPTDVLRHDGPPSRETRLPVTKIVDRLTALGLPVCVSDDAGRYLCNAVLYHSLGHAEASHSPMTSGFVHIPADIGDHHGAALNWPAALRGALEIMAMSLDAAVARRPPRHRRAGHPR
jgi:pyroglutamyl-peptidase